MGNLKITAINSVDVSVENTHSTMTVKGKTTITATGPTHINGTVYKDEGQVATFNAYGVGGQKNVNLTGGSAEVTDVDVITAINDFIGSLADLRPDTAITAVNTSSND